jgi:hypothetical protein
VLDVSHLREIGPRQPASGEYLLPKHLLRQGWEVKHLQYGAAPPQPVVVTPDGLTYGSTELFAVELADVDRAATREQRGVLWSAQPEYRSGFWAKQAHLARGLSDSMAISLLHRSEQKALGEATSGTESWVPIDFHAQILHVLAESWLTALSTSMPTRRDLAVWPRFQPGPRNLFATQINPSPAGETPGAAIRPVQPSDPYGSEPGGTTWGGTNLPGGMASLYPPLANLATPPMGNFQVSVSKLRSAVALSRDWLQDAPFAATYLARAFATDLAAQIIWHALNGGPGIDGTYGFGPGMLFDPLVPSRSLDPAAGDVLSATSDAAFRRLKSSLPGQFKDRPATRVVLHDTLQAAYENLPPSTGSQPIRTRMRDYTGETLFDEIGMIASDAAPPYPPERPSPMLVLGDWSQYWLVTRAGPTMTLIEDSPAADYDQVWCVLHWRGGGSPFDPRAFVRGVL